MTTQGQDAAGTRRRRTHDPERRERIARAAIAVIAKHGMSEVTHRKVAAEAGVPLGSTTYHFATLDELFELALTIAAQDNVAELERWAARLDESTDLAEALVDFVIDSVTEQRDETVLGYSLYAAALHRPRLRPTSVAWDEELAKVFIARTDEPTGRLLAMAVCGMLIQVTLSETVPSRGWLRAVFRQALAGSGPSQGTD